MDQIWQSEKAVSFYDMLEADGYEREIYALTNEIAGSLGVTADKFDNILSGSGNSRLTRKPLIALAKLTLFRYLPTAFKSPFVIYSTDLNGLFRQENVMVDQWDFVNNFNNGELTVDLDKTFRFYYLQGSHPPYQINEAGQMLASYDQLDETLKLPQTTGFFKLLDSYIRELKNLGIYDNTMILIIADHGEGSPDQPDQQPIFFVKNFNERHDEMQVNHAPIEVQQQFLATIAAAIDEDASLYGTPVWDTPEDLVIERHTTYIVGPHYQTGPFYEYTYIGDGSDLHAVYANNEYTSVWSPSMDSPEGSAKE